MSNIGLKLYLRARHKKFPGRGHQGDLGPFPLASSWRSHDQLHHGLHHAAQWFGHEYAILKMTTRPPSYKINLRSVDCKIKRPGPENPIRHGRGWARFVSSWCRRCDLCGSWKIQHAALVNLVTKKEHPHTNINTLFGDEFWPYVFKDSGQVSNSSPFQLPATSQTKPS